MGCRVRCQSSGGGAGGTSAAVYCDMQEDQISLWQDSGLGYWINPIQLTQVNINLAVQSTVGIILTSSMTTRFAAAQTCSLFSSIDVDGSGWCEPYSRAGGSTYVIPGYEGSVEISELSTSVTATATLAAGNHAIQGYFSPFTSAQPVSHIFRQQMLVVIGEDTAAACGNICI